ncbi:MAG: FliM/FliN family flagellar motor switch protein [Sulfitobacter sp.]
MDKPDLKDAASGAEAQTDTQPLAQALAENAAEDAAGEGPIFPHLDTEESLTALATTQRDAGNTGINAMMNVGLDVQIVLGQARMPISRLLELTRGSIVELNRKIGAPVDLMVSDRLVARGDLVKVGEDRLGVSLTQIVKDYVPD